MSKKIHPKTKKSPAVIAAMPLLSGGDAEQDENPSPFTECCGSYCSEAGCCPFGG